MPKKNIFGSAKEKELVTINFEKIISKRLREIAIRDNTSVSSIVNFFCRNIIFNDVEYYRHQAKEYKMKFEEMEYLKEQAIQRKEIEIQVR
jgi:hypothetical protein